MIILRVAMGRGWLKETVREINTALVFVEPVTLHEESREVRMTIHSIEYPTFGPGMPEKRSDTSIKGHMTAVDVVSLA
jgi:hypothetical protein